MSLRKLLLIGVIHLIFLGLMHHKTEARQPPKKPVIVETITFAEPPPKPKPKPKPKARAKAKKKKPIAKKKKTAPPKKPVAKKKKPPPPLPDYRKGLGEQMTLLMRLPEEGCVKVTLTLNRSGKVTKVEILDCNSERNREYVETMLPILCFEPFGRAFGKEAEHTFQLTLYGDA